MHLFSQMVGFRPWVALYLLALNLLVFGMMGFDKARSKSGGWRVPEAKFFVLSALGGSLGGVLGMFFFRHKTRHRAFRLGLPAILLAQIVAVAFWL